VVVRCGEDVIGISGMGSAIWIDWLQGLICGVMGRRCCCGRFVIVLVWWYVRCCLMVVLMGRQTTAGSGGGIGFCWWDTITIVIATLARIWEAMVLKAGAVMWPFLGCRVFVRSSSRVSRFVYLVLVVLAIGG